MSECAAATTADTIDNGDDDPLIGGYSHYCQDVAGTLRWRRGALS